jgi:hypothetical protein
MTNQERSKTGVPHKDADRPSPDVERASAGGQSGARGKAEQGGGPGKMGLTSDEQPDLVAPSGVNERDHGAADDKPMGGGSVNLDDDSELRPRGNTARSGGTWQAQGGDSGKVGKAPGPGLSDRNGPSDPQSKRDDRSE